MTSRSRPDDEHDAVVCADVLGAFGVSTDDVRAETDAPGSSLETALASALDAAGHPTEFLRDVVASAGRGVDAPARYWSHAPAAHLERVFDAIDWSFEMRDAHDEPVTADGESPQPYTLSVTDANGITREAPFEYPETPLADYNLPALLDAVNVRLLYGLGCEFVQLSDGTDRWRFALVETEELGRLRGSYGPRIEVFDRPLLAQYQPGAYVPDDGADDVPLPEWVTRTDGPSLADRAPDRPEGISDLDASVAADPDAVLETEGGLTDGSTADEPADATDLIDFVGGDDDAGTTGAGTVDLVEHADPGWDAESEPAPDADGTADREADEAGAAGSGDTDEVPTAVDAAEPRDGSGGGTAVDDPGQDADAEFVVDVDLGDADDDSATPDDDRDATDGDDEATPFWDEDDWVLDPGSDAEADDAGATTEADDGAAATEPLDTVAGDADTAGSERDGDGPTADRSGSGGTRVAPDEHAATDDPEPDATDDQGTDGFELRGGGPAVSRAADDALDDVFDELEQDAATESVGDPADEGGDDDGFDVAELAGGGANRQAARIEDDDFGVDVECTADDRLAAYGAAIHVGGGISVKGLLDDDDFVPEMPAAERNEVRIEFEEPFDPATPSPAERRETDDGFVWVNEKELADNRL